MKEFVFWALGLLLFCFLFTWLVTKVRYHITDRHVKVSLFGMTLRRVKLANIASVSKRRTDGWAENWWCTFKPNHRALVIRRRRGLIRNVIITPRNRYVFKTELERAMERANAPSAEAPGNVPVFTD